MKGRPSKYTPEIAEYICNRIATSSHGLHKICKEEGMPSVVTVFNWLNKDEFKDFLYNYARAKELQAELLADEIIDISDDTSRDDKTDEEGREYQNSEWINRSRLRVDARKWKASKLYPKKFGERQEIEQTNRGELEIRVIYEDDNKTQAPPSESTENT